jgi:hypothetical protein
MIAFIEEHRNDLGVEPVCKVLPVAQAIFYAHAAIIRNPVLASDRAKRDAVLSPEIKHVWEENHEVYGIRKVWHQMPREKFTIARCRVARPPLGTFPLEIPCRAVDETPIYSWCYSRKGAENDCASVSGYCCTMPCRAVGGQYLSIRYTERLALAGIEPLVGNVGDSYDNAPLGRLLCNRLSGNAWPKR